MSQCPFANLMNPDTFVNGMPYKQFEEMRKVAPLVKMEDPITGVPYWAVLRQKEIDIICKNPDLYSAAERTVMPMEFPQEMIEMIFHKQMINLDPPDHLKYRRIVRKTFTAKAVDTMEERLRTLAKQIVDSVAKRGECEFVEEVAAELPLMAILELMGIPHEDRKDFFTWTNTMMFADDPDMQISEEEGQLAALKVIEYAFKMAAEYRANPKPSIIGQLIDAEIEGDSLTDEEFSWFFVLLIVGGNETTRTVMSQGMRLLMEHPDQLEYLRQNPDKIEGAVEEMLRYNTAFISMRRTSTKDQELGGQQIKKGDKMLMFWNSAGHDEDVFGPDAEVFDVRRAERMPGLANEHRAFGIGQHFCLGSHLARMELNIMFEEIIPRLRNPKFAGKPKYMRSYFVNAIKEMKITFDPEA